MDGSVYENFVNVELFFFNEKNGTKYEIKF